MSTRPINSKSPAEIHCPDCNTRLHPELVDHLLKGNAVYCETCGFRFTGIQSGDVKPLEKKPQQDLSSPQLTKEEQQWIKWKQTWAKIKGEIGLEIGKTTKTITTELNQAFTDAFKPSKKEELPQKESTQQKLLYHPKSPQSFPSPPLSRPDLRSSLITSESSSKLSDNLRSAIHILVELTPFYYAIILFISLFSIFDRNAFYYSIGSFIIEIWIVLVDVRTFLPQERQNKIQHAGLSLILLGFFSLRAYGVGVFVMVRGILHLLLFLRDAAEIKRDLPVIQRIPLRVIWLREVIIAFIPFVLTMFISFYIAGIFTSLQTALQSYPRQFGGFGYSIIAGAISLIIVTRLVIPAFQEKHIEKIPQEKGILLIIAGVISLQNGAGVPLLILGVIFLVFKGFCRDLSDPLPETLEIKDLIHQLVFKEPIQPSITESPVAISSNIGIMQQPLSMDQKIPPIPRFDPMTGAPLTRKFDPATGKPYQEPKGEIFFNFPRTAQHPLQSRIHVIPSPTLSTVSSPKVESVFTVLEPSIRARLLSLPIPVQERNEIARSFIYLTEEQQIRYLDELETVNQDDLNTENLIRRIQALSLPQEQHKFLIDQLQYLPPQKQEEFVHFLEHTVSTSSSH